MAAASVWEYFHLPAPKVSRVLETWSSSPLSALNRGWSASVSSEMISRWSARHCALSHLERELKRTQHLLFFFSFFHFLQIFNLVNYSVFLCQTASNGMWTCDEKKPRILTPFFLFTAFENENSCCSCPVTTPLLNCFEYEWTFCRRLLISLNEFSSLKVNFCLLHHWRDSLVLRRVYIGRFRKDYAPLVLSAHAFEYL